MRKRRTRWTVTFDDGRKEVILAQTAADARAYYINASGRVARVEKGDYRLTSRPATGAQPDLAAITEACAFMGLRLPVEVKLSPRQRGAYGNYWPLPTGGQVRAVGNKIHNIDSATGWKHRITVKNWLTVEQMGETLWHELTHALQFERDALISGLTPLAINRRWRSDYHDGTAYDHKPAEVEARGNQEFNREMPLAR